MTDSKRYAIPACRHETEETIQKSRFITVLAPVGSAEDVQQFFESVRQEHPDATHHCWAFLIGPPGSSAKVGMSDDGEPHGTAGKPMLNVLSHSGVGDIAAMVVRYFGGTKLGKGGLVRAYGNGVALALETLKLVEKVSYCRMRLLLDYSFVDPLKRHLAEFGVRVAEETYGQDPSFLLDVPQDTLAEFSGFLTQMTAGAAIYETDSG